MNLTKTTGLAYDLRAATLLAAGIEPPKLQGVTAPLRFFCACLRVMVDWFGQLRLAASPCSGRFNPDQSATLRLNPNVGGKSYIYKEYRYV